MIKITYMILGIISLIAVVGTPSISSHVFALGIGNLTSSSLTTNPASTSSQPSTSALQSDIQNLISSATSQAQSQIPSQALQSNNPLTASGAQTPQSGLQTLQNSSSIFGQ
jgi:hypothetical protein